MQLLAEAHVKRFDTHAMQYVLTEKFPITQLSFLWSLVTLSRLSMVDDAISINLFPVSAIPVKTEIV